MYQTAQSESSVIGPGAGTMALSFNRSRPTRYPLLAVQILAVALHKYGTGGGPGERRSPRGVVVATG